MPASHRVAAAPLPLAGLGRRYLALVYEVLLLGAVVFVAAIVLVPATLALEPIAARPLLQIALLAVVAAYFVWQWTHGGQTLAMKTWRIRLVDVRGQPPHARRALLRFATALPGTLLLGAGFLWAIVDRDRQFLHDRVAGTRLIEMEAGKQQSAA